jgi:hypothetical protein
VNAYAYCEGDPRNFRDPTGEFSVLAMIQQSLSLVTQTVVPAAMILGPKVSGVALQATRVSLAGSVGTAVGAVMQLAGYPVGAVVSAAGTTASLAGAATRAAVMLTNAYKDNVLWKTIKDNVKNIMGLGGARTVVKPSVQPDMASKNSSFHVLNIRG